MFTASLSASAKATAASLRHVASPFPDPALTRLRARCTGVAIDVDVSTGVPRYAVKVLQEGSAGRTVVIVPDEASARRVWVLLARVLAAPRFVARPDGGFLAVTTMIGPLVGRPVQPRRGRRVALRRKPAARRRPNPPIVAARYSSEREIIARS